MVERRGARQRCRSPFSDHALLISHYEGKPVDTPDWLRFLVAANFDPLKAQELEMRLDLPEPYLSMVLAMAKGDANHAVRIIEQLDAVWYHRWVSAIEAREKGEELRG